MEIEGIIGRRGSLLFAFGMRLFHFTTGWCAGAGELEGLGVEYRGN